MFALILWFGMATANAQQYPNLYLQPGESRVVWEPSARQYVNMICDNGYQQGPGKPCELRYNVTGDPCGYYRLFSGREQMSSCYSDLDTILNQWRSFIASGICARPQAQAPCDVRYNVTGDPCGYYRVYVNNRQASACYSDPASIQGIVRKLRDHQVCY